MVIPFLLLLSLLSSCHDNPKVKVVVKFNGTLDVSFDGTFPPLRSRTSGPMLTRVVEMGSTSILIKA